MNEYMYVHSKGVPSFARNLKKRNQKGMEKVDHRKYDTSMYDRNLVIGIMVRLYLLLKSMPSRSLIPLQLTSKAAVSHALNFHVHKE